MDTITPNWISLPKELLTAIAQRLERLDLLHFCGVCQIFRSVVPRPPKTLYSHPLPGNDKIKLILIESVVYAIEPLIKTSNTQTWLVRVQESKPKPGQVQESKPGQVQVCDPLSQYGFSFKNLSKELPKSLNLLNYRVKEVAKSYKLGIEKKTLGYYLACSPKVAVSACLDAVMTLGKEGDVLVIRSGDDQWTDLDIGDPQLVCKDIIYHNENFYAVLSNGLTLRVDSKSLNISEVAAPLKDTYAGASKYLLKSFNDLYLIDKYDFHLDIRLNVFKLDEEKHQWVQVTNGLKDRVLFVGVDGSFSVSAREFPLCKRNCVYLVDSFFRGGKEVYPGCNVGIYNLDEDNVARLSDSRFYSRIFWPPPVWLKQGSSLAD